VMQPLLLLWLLSSAVDSAKSGARLSYFEVLHLPPPRRWPAFVVSAVLHAVLLLALPTLLGAIDPIDEPAYWARQLRPEQTLRIRIPERLYLASGGRREAVPQRRTEAGQAAGRVARRAGAERAGVAKARARGGVRRRFQLPELARRSRQPQSLLQPELSPELPLAAGLRLPEVFFWAPRSPLEVRAKVMAVPGFDQVPAGTARLDTPPAVETPSELPGLPLTLPPALYELTEAALSAAARMPLRLPLPPTGELRGSTTETSSGDPLTVLSLSTEPRPLREILLIPPANQLGVAPRGGGGPGAPGPGAAQSAGGGGGPSGTGPAQAAAEGNDPLPRPDVAGPLPATAGGLPAAAEAPAAGTSAAVPGAPLAGETRLEHPVSGVFDVVVQSADADGLPESAGVLTGRPVYSAYLNVGGPREWLLQYCIPGGEVQTVEVAGGVVRLASPSPLVAPYPRVTFRPPMKARPGGPYVVVHGFLEISGRLENLRVLGVHGAEDAPSLLPVLHQWELRPATQDNRAVRVEILLAIPLAGG